MSTESTNEGAAPSPGQSAGEKAIAEGRLQVGSAAEQTDFEIGRDGKPVVRSTEEQSLDLGSQPEGEEKSPPEGEEPEGDAPEPKDGEEGSAEEEATPAEGEVPSLGEFDPENPEIVAKFDERFINKEDGTLNENAIGEEFWSDYEKLSPEDRAKADLRPETRAFLKSTYKVSDAFIDQTRDGLVALQRQTDDAFSEPFGGRDKVEAMMAWAREGGYTEEQRAAFNDLRKTGGPAFKDALELMASRHAAATTKPVVPGRRSSPERSATGGAAHTRSTSDTTGLYATRADYQKDWTAAITKEKELRKTKSDSPEARAAHKAQEALIDGLRKKGRKSNHLWK